MSLIENDVEKIIMNYSNSDLKQKGLLIDGYKKNQVNLKSFGIADIITFQKGGFTKENIFNHSNYLPNLFTIYELKKDVITEEVFFQSIRYVVGLLEYLNDRKLVNIIENSSFKITLIGKKIKNEREFKYLQSALNGFLDLDLFTYTYELNGIMFHYIK